jgi:hypothetical protein
VEWKHVLKIYSSVFFFFFLMGGTGFELRASCLQSRRCAGVTGVTLPVHFALVILEMWVL